MEELDKLRDMLDKDKIEYVNKSVVSKNDGMNIYYKDYNVSVISHKFSYGGNNGLLELMAKNKIQGWLTAERAYEVLKSI